MHLNFRNVNDAFRGIVKMFRDEEYCNGSPWTLHGNPAPITRTTSRNGPVLMIDEPVTVTYSHPLERVLFHPVRDANPFFHVYEALWMLAGRNDVAPLQRFVGRIKEFSDDGVTMNGAYGYRWRHAPVARQSNGQSWPDADQLDTIVSHLKAYPDSRRAVLQMWNVEDDLFRVGGETTTSWNRAFRTMSMPSKDVCCNLSVMFALRRDMDRGPKCVCGADRSGPSAEAHKADCPAARSHTVQMVPHLDMTVTNRSNDLIWGMLGANYVHFTFLQEYMAARLGVKVGRYHHVTNNLHVYAERKDWQPTALLDECEDLSLLEYRFIKKVPLVKDADRFEQELPEFVQHWSHEGERTGTRRWSEPFLDTVARPMMAAHALRDNAMDGTIGTQIARIIAADDWRIVTTDWLQRRKK